MMTIMREEVSDFPGWHSHWGQFMLKQAYPYHEVAILGAEVQSFRLDLSQPYGQRLFAGASKDSQLPLLANRYQEGKTMVYVCEDYTCQLPTDSPEKAKNLLR